MWIHIGCKADPDLEPDPDPVGKKMSWIANLKIWDLFDYFYSIFINEINLKFKYVLCLVFGLCLAHFLRFFISCIRIRILHKDSDPAGLP